MDECRKQFDEVVASDHPDLVGGIVWSDCELRWINEKLHTAKAAGMREAAQLVQDMDYQYVAGEILKAAEMVESGA